MSVLIKIAAPPPSAVGMDTTSPLDIGHPPPWISPHCARCNLPVETFTIDWVASPHYLPIQFTCHGQTGGMKVSREEALYKSKHGGATWVFTETKVSRGR